jgi:hypothetical protein
MQLNLPIRTRHLVPQRWNVQLVNAAGAAYDLGSVDIASAAAIAVPSSVPNGVYSVEITADGLAWRGVLQKSIGSLTIDSTASAPYSVDWPLFTDFSYEIENEWIKLKWNGDVPPELSGLVSAGLWLGYGVPDFAEDPSVTIPLFSHESEHVYFVQEDLTWGSQFAPYHWSAEHWDAHWNPLHWPGAVATPYAGLAPVARDGTQGSGQYIALPNRVVLVPPAAIRQG